MSKMVSSLCVGLPANSGERTRPISSTQYTPASAKDDIVHSQYSQGQKQDRFAPVASERLRYWREDEQSTQV
jgi:hypothetical protein